MGLIDLVACTVRSGGSAHPQIEARQTDSAVRPGSATGLGLLEPLLKDPLISDVLVNSDGMVWVERDGALDFADIRFDSPEQILAAIERVIAPLGLRLDRASPAVDARLDDGSRLHAVIPPIAVDGPALAIRRFTPLVTTVAELVDKGAVSKGGAEILVELVHERRNILVCGPTGSGKTTLLNVLSHEIPETERIVTVEDAAELQLSGHVIRLEGKPANTEGAGSITLRQLVRHALRLRPDRIVVGEVRGPEAFDMIQALSTGHDGSMSTIHASGPDAALWRLETLALLESSVSPATVHRQVESVVDAVVVVGRGPRRRVVRAIHLIGEHPGEVYSCS